MFVTLLEVGGAIRAMEVNLYDDAFAPRVIDNRTTPR